MGREGFLSLHMLTQDLQSGTLNLSGASAEELSCPEDCTWECLSRRLGDWHGDQDWVSPPHMLSPGICLRKLWI